MADIKKQIPSWVTTFVAEVPVITVQEALDQKFQGKKTPKTLEAARRMAKARKKVKIPSNLVVRLWNLTGGWKEGALKSGWGQSSPDSSWVKVILGDLECILQKGYKNSYMYLRYRGMEVASFTDYYGWLNGYMLSELSNTLGVPYN